VTGLSEKMLDEFVDRASELLSTGKTSFAGGDVIVTWQRPPMLDFDLDEIVADGTLLALMERADLEGVTITIWHGDHSVALIEPTTTAVVVP
jgi:hypothetical protein